MQSESTARAAHIIQGAAIGEALVPALRVIKKSRRKASGYSIALMEVRAVFDAFEITSVYMDDHQFMLPMMARVTMNRLRLRLHVNIALNELTPEEGEKIGQSLANSLVINATGEAGVDEWVVNCPALQELDSTQPWFRPMMKVVSRELLKEADWGSKVRLYFGAGVSMLDLASDVYMVNEYLTTDGLEREGYRLLTMIGVCITFQLFIVYFVHGKRSLRVMLLEMLIVILGVKPGIDAGRVAAGQEQIENTLIDPITELTISKVMEMVCESIPGARARAHTHPPHTHTHVRTRTH